MRKLMTLAALCALPTVLSAQATPSAPAPAAPAKEKKVCRQEDQTGSIMMHRTCHTKEEWLQIDAENTKNAQHVLGRDSVAGANAATRGN